jgi:polyhydroxyalkanoate synthesis regulator phasin
MKIMPAMCDCERGGDCSKTTVCAIGSALEEQADLYDTEIQALKDQIEELNTHIAQLENQNEQT